MKACILTQSPGRSESGKKYLYTLSFTSPPYYHRIIQVGRNFQYHLVQLYVTLIIFPLCVRNKAS